MNSMEIEYYIGRYGVIGAAEKMVTLADSGMVQAVQLHILMVRTHEAALKQLLLSQAEDDDD